MNYHQGSGDCPPKGVVLITGSAGLDEFPLRMMLKGRSRNPAPIVKLYGSFYLLRPLFDESVRSLLECNAGGK